MKMMATVFREGRLQDFRAFLDKRLSEQVSGLKLTCVPAATFKVCMGERHTGEGKVGARACCPCPHG